MNEEENKILNKSDSVKIETEVKNSYIDYAMSVIVSRAIPDVRDGLKPVHRRILYSMHDSGFHAGKPYRKSSRVVGDVIGKYHPHGDAAVYDSLVRMAQDFSLRHPLIDGQGNFGSMDGDAPAAMRYTESRLAKISHKILEDIDKNTVDFQDNYDNSEREPTILPSRFPNLLVNGSGGIAVGMATNIPPHNLGEIIDACILYVNNNDVELSELLNIVKGPDFPTKGLIVGTANIKAAYETGRGIITMRGRARVEDNGKNTKIIISELPFMVNKAKLVEKIASLVNEKRIEGVSDLRDESNKEGVRIVVEVKRDSNADIILNQIYSFTPLQSSFGIIMLALDDGVPKVMGLKHIISSFVNFREKVITRRIVFLLEKARARAHILLGLSCAIANIDEMIQIIKDAPSPEIARSKLLAKRWNIDDMAPLVRLIDENYNQILDSDNMMKLSIDQAKAILDMKLSRLTAIEKSKLKDDLTQLSKEIKEFLEILSSRDKLLEILKNELLEIKSNFANPRLTEIVEGSIDTDHEDLIQREDMVVTVTLSGYIKRVPLSTYRVQNRGGKGRSGLSMSKEDITTQIFVGNTHTKMLFFASNGLVYSLKLYKLPLATPQSRGKPIINILPLEKGQTITNIVPMMEDKADQNIIFATKKGNVRRNKLSDFESIQSNGKIAIRLDDDDSLIDVKICSDNDHVMLATYQGRAIRFPVDKLRVFKSRTSDGVRGMKLAQNDQLISMTILHGAEISMLNREAFLSIPLKSRKQIAQTKIVKDKILKIIKEKDSTLTADEIIKLSVEEEFILTVTNNGFGKKTSAYEYRVTNRGGAGITNINISGRTGNVTAVMPATFQDEIMLITNNGTLIRCNLESVRTTGRNTSGVILFKTSSEEKVSSVSLIRDESEDESSA